MRILVVEDHADILANIADYLGIHGHTVDCARDGLNGWQLASTGQYDLIVLDVMLPGMDGFSLCQKLRSELRSAIPVIMLTARDALDDRLQGFKVGVDDYLVKPFALSELAARIEAIARRSHGGASRVLQVEDLRYDLDTLQITRSEKVLKLNPVALKLLEVLMRCSPNVVRRDALEHEIWGDDTPDSDSLRTHIHQLRQIVDKPFAIPLLHTVHGIGYRFARESDEK